MASRHTAEFKQEAVRVAQRASCAASRLRLKSALVILHCIQMLSSAKMEIPVTAVANP